MTCLNRGSLGTSIFHFEDGPVFAYPKQRAGRNLQHIRRLPDYNSYFDSVRISQSVRSVDEIKDNVDPLFFNSECRDFGKCAWLNYAHSGTQRLVSTPIVNNGFHVRADLDCVLRKEVRHDFQFGCVSYFNDWCSCGDDTLALFDQPENPSCHWRLDRNR